MKQNPTSIKKRVVLKALESTLGNVTQALKISKMHRSTYYRWLKEDKEFADKVQDLENHTFDFVESKIMKLIQEENPTMIIFYAKTKMKSRGYIERSEIHMDNKPSFIIADSDKEMKTLLDVIHKRNDKAG